LHLSVPQIQRCKIERNWRAIRNRSIGCNTGKSEI
jgi:hypothetical protein